MLKKGASALLRDEPRRRSWSRQGVDSVILCGATTSGCIRATAIDLLQYGYPTLVPRECVADRAQAPHEANLFDINAKYADVVSLDDVARVRRGRAGGPSAPACDAPGRAPPRRRGRPGGDRGGAAGGRRARPRDRVDGAPLGLGPLARARPDDAGRTGAERARRVHDAVLMGAVGDPSVPDHVSLWGLILELRQRLDLWANLRPARLLEGIPGPLAGRGPGDVDMLFLRENTEGEYSGVGGRAHQGLPSEVGIETSVFTRAGRRARRSATRSSSRQGGAASSRARPSRTRRASATCSGTRSPRRSPASSPASATSGCSSTRSRRGWCATRAASTSSSRRTSSATSSPTSAAAIQGGMGMAASANVAPGSEQPGLFEPVHGSAPDIAGQGIANPAGAIWSAALMLEHLGEPEAARDADGRARGRLPGRAAHARRRRRRVDARGRRGGRRPGGRAQRTIPMIAPPATTSTPASDEPRADPLAAPPDQERRRRTTAQSDCVAFSGATIDTRPRSNASSRLRVGEPEDDAGGREGGQRRPQVRAQRRAAPEQHPGEDDEEGAEQRGGRGGERRRMRVAGGPAGDVVADGEQRGADEREDGAERAEVLRPRPLAGEHGSAARPRAPSRRTSSGWNGSSSSASAIATDISGAVPIRIDDARRTDVADRRR